MENSKSTKSNTGYKGIYWRKQHSKFLAKIMWKHGGIEIHIGMFETLKEAVKAREDFIKSLF